MFTGKVALVTGAGRGLGKAVAVALGRQGAKVAVNDVNPDNAEATVREIVAAGGEAAAWIADVSRKHMIHLMIDEVVERWGRIDILVNSAHVEPRASILKMDEWDWERAIGVNLKGPFLMCQSVGRTMQQSGGGVIVNVAFAPDGRPDRAAFFAGQAGLIELTRECAREFAAFDVRVNAVCLAPGAPASPGQRNAVEQALFLCSDAAGAITGQVITVQE